MVGENCTIEAGSYGTLSIRIDRLSYGKTVVSSEGEARRFKAFYPMLDTTSNFSINAIFKKWSEFNTFNLWFSTYANLATNPYLGAYSPMTVTVPSRRFKLTGYPISDFQFGDEFGRVKYECAVTFIAADDPLERNLGASQFVPALRDAALSGPFYPTTTTIQRDEASSFAQPPVNSNRIFLS